MSTRTLERDQLAAAPEMERAFQQELVERGAEGASMSERVANQLADSGERVEA